ncbi:hypothetical protein ES708_24913 [subsurface metagenome]
MKKTTTTVFAILILFTMMNTLFAQNPNLSIYELQYTENSDGSSYYDEQIVDCNGGIVIHKWSRGRERLVLYDPNYPDGWGGVLVKGPFDSNVFEDVNVGDWIRLEDVTVYEELNKARGNTTLFYDEDSSCPRLSRGNELPAPLVVDVNNIAVVYNDVNETCYVTDHRAEKYEAMYIQVRNVTVGDYNDAGSHRDNYSLEDNNDPNIYCWASDYMNIDKPPDPEKYMPVVQTGQHFCSVSGILEQYTQLSYDWDYYQLLTTYTGDLKRYTPADLDGDCMVDFSDFAVFCQYWLWGTE